MTHDNPDPWLLELVARFREDPVVDLDRVDQPSHVLVQAIYRGVGPRSAVVAYELISGPPPPTNVTYAGRFERARLRSDEDAAPAPERPWFVFLQSLSFERNVARFCAHARGTITAFGKRPEPPLLDDEPLFGGGAFGGGETQALAIAPVVRGPAPAPPEPPPPAPSSRRGADEGPAPGSGGPRPAPKAPSRPVPPSASKPPSGPMLPSGSNGDRPPRRGPASGPPPSQPPFLASGAKRPSGPPPEPPPPPPLHGSGPPPSGHAPSRPPSRQPPEVPGPPGMPSPSGPPPAPRRGSGPPPAPRRGSVPPPPPEPPPPPGVKDREDA